MTRDELIVTYLILRKQRLWGAVERLRLEAGRMGVSEADLCDCSLSPAGKAMHVEWAEACKAGRTPTVVGLWAGQG